MDLKLALYCHYGYYLSPQQALKKMHEHGIMQAITWLGQDPYCTTNIDEHELYATLRDAGLQAPIAYLPNNYLPYLANARYGRKEAIRAYKQYVLSGLEYGVGTIICDALPATEPYIEAMQEICDYATEQGMIVCVRDGAEVDIVGLLGRVPNLYYCLDTAVCLKNNIDPLQRIEVLQQRLLAVVLSDLAMDDTRLLPGTGKTDFGPILQAIAATGYQGVVGIHAVKAVNLDADAFLEAAKALA